MEKGSRVVRISSKGQIVIPASVRRKLRLKTGQSLAVRAASEDEIVLRPVDRETGDVDAMRDRLRHSADSLGKGLLKEFHDRRKRERKREDRKREPGRH